MHDNKLIVIGAGGHARACIDVIEQVGRYELFWVDRHARRARGRPGSATK